MSNLKPRTKRILIIIGAILILGIIGTYTGKKKAAGKTKRSDDLCTTAFMISNKFAKRRIPGKADFPFADFKCQKRPDGVYIIYSYVNTDVNIVEDVNRSYREGTRVNYSCKLKFVGTDRFDPSHWQEISLVFSSL